jgi:hypothetical protein
MKAAALESLPDSSGCCAGIEPRVPLSIYNRPRLSSLRWRIGEYADFFETLVDGLASAPVDAETEELGRHGRMRVRRLFPLRDLRQREMDDPTIALLDAWAVLADVLSFYTERIAQEGYLRTLTELRSAIELARLLGYRRRPGVAASVYLAFTADDTWKGTDPIAVPVGAKVQSLPGPNEQPVYFEIDAPLLARPEWNVLRVRQARPTYLPTNLAGQIAALYLQHTATNLDAGSRLLFIYDDKRGDQVLRIVAKVTPDFDHDRTRVELTGAVRAEHVPTAPVSLDTLVAQLERPPSLPPANAARLNIAAAQSFGRGSAGTDRLMLAFHPAAASTILQARATAQVTPASELRTLIALRVKATVYAATAPPRMRQQEDGRIVPDGDWDLVETSRDLPTRFRVLDLDTTYDAILPESWVVIERPFKDRNQGRPKPALRQVITKVISAQSVSRADYNFPAKVTRLQLRDPWLDADDNLLGDIRSTTVYAVPDPLNLDFEPIEDPICGGEIELDREIDGLEPGRWLIITGERASAPAMTTESAPGTLATDGVVVSELVMLWGVRQDTLYVKNEEVIPPSAVAPDCGSATSLPGDLTHSFLQLAVPLSYCYKRSTVTIHANVAHATHGETRQEVLGSGDAQKAFQTFLLKNAPITYTAAASPSGIESTLSIYVNDIRWHEVESLFDLGPADRGYVIYTDADDRTSMIFGDGLTGAPLSSGNENVRAKYRNGIGAGGNVRSNQLTQIVALSEGLRGVTNPRPATGGADPEGLESVRARIPLAVTALDRLVGTVDYADFARLFAGIAKSSAARLPTSHGQLVHVTIAGQDDIPIGLSSDLYRNLTNALETYGDPNLPIRVSPRELLLLIVVAKICIAPDYLWEKVKPQVETALWTEFAFERRNLGQDAYAAEAVAAIQAVCGVTYVKLDLFTAVSEKTPPSKLATLGTKLSGTEDRIAAAPDRIEPFGLVPSPAQLVILSRAIPETLMLSEIRSD